jgi:5S rRNA maturation endonuclease (ribonuclease M5)
MADYASPEVALFLSKLQGVKKSGANWAARCPCRNDDMNPSLSIGQGDDGRVLVTCHRGTPCDVKGICSAMDIRPEDMFPDKSKEEKERVKVKTEPTKPQKLTLVASYDYRDALGELLFQKQRFVDAEGKKTFRQRRPDENGEWTYQLGEVPRVLYRLPQVANAIAHNEQIWIVEGEKDVDTLVALGLCATTQTGGAGVWLDIHTESLEGASIAIITDNDVVGRKHALHVASELRKVGCEVVMYQPPAKYKDVTDVIEAGKTLEDLEDFSEANLTNDEEYVAPPEEHYEEDTSPEEEPMSELLRGITNLFERDDLTEDQRINRASILMNSFGRTTTSISQARHVNWEEFLLESESDAYEWVIPNLIEKQERVIVVAAEGVGKTMLARQVALCASAGLHPFTMAKIPPVRTLTIDLENPERIIRRTSRNIMAAAKRFGHASKVEAELLIKPAGIDLLKASDRALIEEAIEKAKPQLVILGPLYKAFVDPGGRTSESVAIEVAKYLDSIRDYYGCALWLEHHAPLGSSMGSRDLRPFGSAVWSRWPEFGLSLTPDPTSVEGFVYNVSHFRGARDQRQFPTKMKRGKVFPFEVLEFMKVD